MGLASILRVNPNELPELIQQYFKPIIDKLIELSDLHLQAKLKEKIDNTDKNGKVRLTYKLKGE